MTVMLTLDLLRSDGGTQIRSEINPLVVSDYAESYREGANIPPVVVFYDGHDYWLADGFHRAEAARKAGLKEIAVDVRPGTRRDAILHACGANATHGLPRTNADKRRAVETMLRDEEWWDWSDNDIARQCCVSNRFVGEVRKELEVTLNRSKSTRRKGADGRIIDTSNIGKPKPAPPTPAPGLFAAGPGEAAAQKEVEATEPEEDGPAADEAGPQFIPLPDCTPEDRAWLIENKGMKEDDFEPEPEPEPESTTRDPSPEPGTDQGIDGHNSQDDVSAFDAEGGAADHGGPPAPPQLPPIPAGFRPAPPQRRSEEERHREKILYHLDEIDQITRALAAPLPHGGFGGPDRVVSLFAGRDRLRVRGKLEMFVERLREWVKHFGGQVNGESGDEERDVP